MPKLLIYFTVGLLFISFMSLPYGYYMLLKIITFSVFSWAAYITFENNEEVLPWVLIMFAIIFNPILQIHFAKEMWLIIDFISGFLLIFIKDKIQNDSKIIEEED